MELHLTILILMLIQYDFENVIIRIRKDTNHIIEYLYAINHIWLFSKLNLSINVNFLGLAITNLFDIQYVPESVFFILSIKQYFMNICLLQNEQSQNQIHMLTRVIVSFDGFLSHLTIHPVIIIYYHAFASIKIWRLMLFFGVMLFWFWFTCLLVQESIIKRNQSIQIQDRLFLILQTNWRKWKMTCRILDKIFVWNHQAFTANFPDKDLNPLLWCGFEWMKFYRGTVGYVPMFLVEPCQWRTEPTAGLLSNIGLNIRALFKVDRLEDSWLLKNLLYSCVFA